MSQFSSLKSFFRLFKKPLAPVPRKSIITNRVAKTKAGALTKQIKANPKHYIKTAAGTISFLHESDAPADPSVLEVGDKPGSVTYVDRRGVIHRVYTEEGLKKLKEAFDHLFDDQLSKANEQLGRNGADDMVQLVADLIMIGDSADKAMQRVSQVFNSRWPKSRADVITDSLVDNGVIPAGLRNTGLSPQRMIDIATANRTLGGNDASKITPEFADDYGKVLQGKLSKDDFKTKWGKDGVLNSGNSTKPSSDSSKKSQGDRSTTSRFAGRNNDDFDRDSTDTTEDQNKAPQNYDDDSSDAPGQEEGNSTDNVGDDNSKTDDNRERQNPVGKGINFDNMDPNAGDTTAEDYENSWSTPHDKAHEENWTTDGNEDDSEVDDTGEDDTNNEDSNDDLPDEEDQESEDAMPNPASDGRRPPTKAERWQIIQNALHAVLRPSGGAQPEDPSGSTDAEISRSIGILPDIKTQLLGGDSFWQEASRPPVSRTLGKPGFKIQGGVVNPSPQDDNINPDGPTGVPEGPNVKH